MHIYSSAPLESNIYITCSLLTNNALIISASAASFPEQRLFSTCRRKSAFLENVLPQSSYVTKAESSTFSAPAGLQQLLAQSMV